MNTEPENSQNTEEQQAESNDEYIIPAAQRAKCLQAWQELIEGAGREWDLPRTPDEIGEEISRLVDIVWYYRCHRVSVAEGPTKISKEIWDAAFEQAKKIKAKYETDELGPFSDFEWGMINGKLAALRWALGSEPDSLDT